MAGIGHAVVEPARRARCIHHRGDDLAVAGAAAEHAAQRVLRSRPRSGAGCGREARLPPPAGPACRCRIAPRHARGTRPAAPTACRWPGPSTVVTAAPVTDAAGIRQAQTGSPSTRTVQAPQSPASQPTLVPVSRSSSRSTERQPPHRRHADADGGAVDLESDLGAMPRTSCRVPLFVAVSAAWPIAPHGATTISRAASSRYSALPRTSPIGDSSSIGADDDRVGEPARLAARRARRPPPRQALGDRRAGAYGDGGLADDAILDDQPHCHHGDGDDEIAPRAELEERRMCR